MVTFIFVAPRSTQTTLRENPIPRRARESKSDGERIPYEFGDRLLRDGSVCTPSARQGTLENAPIIGCSPLSCF